MKHTAFHLKTIFISAVIVLGGCAVGPVYQKPDIAMPANWTPEAPWQKSEPRDAELKGDWWTLFNDAKLNELEQLALKQNYSLQIAEAHLTQARQLVNAATASLFPSLNAGVAAGRQKSSANRPLSNYSTPSTSTVQNDFNVHLNVQYEADFFGRLRYNVQGLRAAEEQSKADLENARLLLTAEVATDYFSIRALDTEIKVIQQNIELQQHALDYVSVRHDKGVASGIELARQQTQLKETSVQLQLLKKQRYEYEHALATLLGIPAPQFKLEPSTNLPAVPQVAIGIPSTLLERRPDIAHAERAMAVANAQIGVAKAAFFPGISLSPTVGWDSNELSKLFDASSLLWSFGLSATQTIFDWGKTKSNVEYAKSGYDATVAQYKQTVLTAMQEVENGIKGYAILGRANEETTDAIKSSQQLLELVNIRYQGGIATDLERVTAQQDLLNNQRQLIQIQGQQWANSVYLIKALGGGWSTNDLSTLNK